MDCSREQFLANLAASGLLAAAEVTALEQTVPPDQRPRTGTELAQFLVRRGKLTAFQASHVLHGKTQGLVFGDYVILDKLGHGGMGAVLKARHRRMDRLVAVKRILSTQLKSPDAVQRFHREVKAAARLTHPNIVIAHDAGQHAGVHYLVMEYVEGQDLATLVQHHGRLPVLQAVQCVLQAARGLEYAHAQGVIHRDIKPSNLLLSTSGVVKILDMGLARTDHDVEQAGAHPVATLTETGQVMGTCHYMAPEQILDTHEADHRSDIYSLGCTLYQLVTGHPPYAGRTRMQVLLAHRDAAIPSLQAHRTDVSQVLDAIFQRMVAKRPDARYQSMNEVIAALESYLVHCQEATQYQGEEGDDVGSTTSALQRLAQYVSQTQTGTAAPPPAIDETQAMQSDVDTHGASHRAAPPRTRTRQLFPRRLVLILSAAILVLLVVNAVVLFLNRRPASDQTTRGGTDPVPSAAGGGPSSGVTEPGKSTAPGFGVQRRARSAEWQAARKEADAKAKTLADEQRFGEAIQQYESLPVQSHDTILRELVDGAVAELKTRAAQAYGEIETRTRQLLAENKFAEARAQLQPVVERFGVTEHVAAANALLSDIAAAELAAAPKDPPTPPQPTPEELAAQQALERQRQLEARYAEALKPVETLAAAWDFARAAEEIDAIQFEEAELAARVTQRRDELRRMHELKQKIIAAVNKADPPLRKRDLGIKGTGGDVTAADETGFTATLLGGKTETIPWSSIETSGLAQLFAPKQLERLLPSVEPDDWLAAGLVALAVGSGSEADHCFEQARTLGVNSEPYLASLAAAAFAEANTMLANYEYAQADAALGTMEEKYAAIPWYPANKQAIAAARDAARIGIAKTQEAETLYAEAVRLLGQKELFDVKAIVQKLKTEFADATVVQKRGRDPSLLDLENAVANVPKAITVRLDGKGDFQSIQAAIDAAPSQSLIEIEDNGPYHEKVLIPKDKYEIRLRGKKGCWPVVTSEGLPTGPLPLVSADGSGTSLERMVLLGGIAVSSGDVRLRRLLVHGSISASGYQRKCEVEVCLVTGGGRLQAAVVFTNCLVLGGVFFGEGSSQAHFSTVPTGLGAHARPGQGVRDSILGDSASPAVLGWGTGAVFPLLENCTLLAGHVPEGSRDCFKADPMFVDPQNFDYRLQPGSPCIGKASDGGDIGCRYTPEMIELCQKALELRRQGILKF